MVARKLYVRFGWAHRWLTPRSPRARQAGVATEAELASDHVCRFLINSVAGLSASGLQLDRLLHRRQHWR
jgi:hypothetical protein